MTENDKVFQVIWDLLRADGACLRALEESVNVNFDVKITVTPKCTDPCDNERIAGEVDRVLKAAGLEATVITAA